MKRKKLFIGGGIVLAVVTIELVLYFFTGAFGRTAIRTLFRNDTELGRTRTEYIPAERGEILDCKGRVIAANKTLWDVHLDCTVLDVPESEWESLARSLSEELKRVVGDESVYEYEYFKKLMAGRTGNKRYLKLCGMVDDSVAAVLRKAPILNMSQFRGGRIFTPHNMRNYLFGSLCHRTIGHLGWHPVGIEGAYNQVLGGEAGKVEYVRKCRKGRYYWKEVSRIEPEDGKDVTAALDMDIAAVVDSVICAALVGSREVNSVCAALMDVKSGAVRAMVNRMHQYDGSFKEVFNVAIGFEYEPGTVLTQLPPDILEKGLEGAGIDIEGLREASRVSCTPLHVLRIFGGIANGGVMFNPYLVTPSSSSTLCSPAVADSLKAAMNTGCLSTALMPLNSDEGVDRYRDSSGRSIYSTTWAGFFTAGGVGYALVVTAFSDRTMADAPQKGIPEKAAKGIMKEIREPLNNNF